MNCIVCNRELTGPIWEPDLHLECADELLAFVLRSRSTGNAYVKGVIEVLLTGTRLSMERERLRA